VILLLLYFYSYYNAYRKWKLIYKVDTKENIQSTQYGPLTLILSLLKRSVIYPHDVFAKGPNMFFFAPQEQSMNFVNVLGKHLIITSDVEIVNHVLRNYNDFPKKSLIVTSAGTGLIGKENVLIANGEEWRNMSGD